MPDPDGFTALMLACMRTGVPRQQHAELIKVLLQNKADPRMRTVVSRSSPLHFAARCANADVLKLIRAAAPRDFEVGLNYCNLDDETPLAWSCLGGNFDTFRWLLDAKADINYMNQFGMNTLMFAVVKNADVRCWLMACLRVAMCHRFWRSGDEKRKCQKPV